MRGGPGGQSGGPQVLARWAPSGAVVPSAAFASAGFHASPIEILAAVGRDHAAAIRIAEVPMRSAFLTATAAFVLAASAPATGQVYGQPYGGSQPAAPYGQYGAPASGAYGAPAPGYGAPPAGYGAPQPGYGSPPQPGYGQPPAGYGPPAGAYGAPAPAYGAPAPAYGSTAAPPQAYNAPPAGGYGANAAAVAQADCSNTGAIVGGLVGALGGGLIGNSVAGHGNKTEGTVLGGVLGGGAGALVGHAHDKHQCDQRGAYWSYGDTVPYRVDNAVAPDPHAAEYVSRGCRLAPATVNGQESRYVRVCPDADGRYRIAG